MATFPNIERYYASLTELIEAGGSDNELSIRPAFQNCLAAYCAAHKNKLVLVPELAASKGTRPDGTVRDALRMARGNWEARDSRVSYTPYANAWVTVVMAKLMGRLDMEQPHEAAHPTIPDSVMNYDDPDKIRHPSISDDFDEPDCSPHPFDLLAIYALYQSGARSDPL